MTTEQTIQQTIKRVSEPTTFVKFQNWTDCTCGQLYQTVTGRQATEDERVHSPVAEMGYIRVLVDIAAVLLPQVPIWAWSPGDAAKVVSDHTARRLPRGQVSHLTVEDQREATLATLREALGALVTAADPHQAVLAA